MNWKLLALAWCCWASVALAISPEVERWTVYPEWGELTTVLTDDTARSPRWVYLGGTGIAGSYQFYALKVDSTGGALWTRSYGNQDRFTRMIRAQDSSLMMIGYTTANPTVDYRLMRLLPGGAQQGNYSFGGNAAAEIAYGIAQREDGWFYLTGERDPDGAEPRAISLLKINAQAQIEWAQNFPQGSSGMAIALDGDSGLFIYGTRDSSATGTSRDVMFIRADTLGENPRVRVFEGSDWEECRDAIRLSAERTLIVGGARDASGGAWDLFALMTNDAGDSLWSRRYGTTANDYALAVTATTDLDSGFVIAGWSEGLVPGERRGLLMKITAAGDSLWTLYAPENAASELMGVMQDGRWRYHAAGYVDRDPHHGCYLITEPDPHSPEPHAPTRFSLLAPENEAVLDSGEVEFSWEAALDPDEHDTVRYTLELAFDTTFATGELFGPLDTTHFSWTADTDDVGLYWRVTATDLLGNSRVCRERYRQFSIAIPDSTAEFSLLYPDSGMGLPRTLSEFRWERADDPDANDTVSYTIHFMVGDTGFAFPGLPDTFINVSFAGNPLIGEADTVWWRVVARSVVPPMERDSREVWSFVTWSADADDFASLPLEFALEPPFPNPFNAVTHIRYSVDRLEAIRLDLFDIQGRRVTTLAEGTHTPGRYEREWNAADQASGTYFVRLTGADRARTAKLILLK